MIKSVESTSRIAIPKGVDIQPSKAAAAAIDKQIRNKAKIITKKQNDLRRKRWSELTDGEIKDADQRTALFRNVPSHGASDEGALNTVNEPIPKVKPDPEDDTSLPLAERAFRGMLKTEDFSVDDLLPWRLRVAYRIVREMARLRNLVSDGDLLSEIEADHDPWMQPMPLRTDRVPARDIAQCYETLQIFAEAEMMVIRDQYSRPSYKPGVDRFTFRGIALLPPPVPDRFITPDCKVMDSYDPYQDTALTLYIEAIESIVKYLRIEQGCEMDPQVGVLGMRYLYDPEMIRLIFPTRTQFMCWEELLIEQTVEKLINFGTLGTQKYLKQSHGFSSHEISNLIKTSKIMITRRNEFDPDEERALMALRIEDYIKRSRDALDLKAESFGLKQLSLIQGLGKTDPENADNEMFLAVARNVASMRPALESSVPLLEQ